MQQANTPDEFEVFRNRTYSLCTKLGLKWENYSTPEELFQAVANKFPENALLSVDEVMGDDHLRDDLLGVMHRAVRERSQAQYKGGLSA
ncbi:hypothetical protein BRE01_26940 [Brevibacillus reuszeri]|nr:hypothetical protein [Brevibacillus reuszeri]MED1858018.1 hypothetical protein [Brevibacillus reuszeri]GED68992.1 hypothetical protein BRE01_26940 [Brevibacillus reuszeri]